MTRLQIALVIPGRRVDAYAAAFCEWALQQPGIALSLLDAGAGAVPQAGWRRTAGHGLAGFLWSGVMLAERALLHCYRAHRNHFASVALAEFAKTHMLAVLPAYESLAGGEPAARPDLLVVLGHAAGAAPGLPEPRMGTLRIDYRRDRISDEAPIGFWDAYHARPKTGFAVLVAAPGEARPRLLAEGAFRTKYAFLLNQAQLLWKAQAQLRRVLLDIAEAGRLPAARDTVPYSGACLAPPGSAAALAYLLKIGGRLVKRGVRRSLGIQQRWNLCITRAGWRDAAFWRGARVSAPRGHFWADPFLHVQHGRTYCFVEDYVYATHRAHISVLEITAHGVECLGVALREDFHLSFPFLFEYGGRLYMCPEASESGQVRLYQCDEFPLRWSLHSVALDRISAADSVFFEHGGKWWLMTSLDRSGMNDHCSELCLFHADSPLAGKWTPHPQNPLCIDTDMGRNAGLITEGGRIFRAAQRQGFDQYGEGLALYEVLALDERRYLERKLTDIEHDYLDRSLGSHHISSKGGITVVDYKMHSFAP